MAWIGWYDPETRLLVPVAECGDEGQYLKGIKIYTDERPEGCGPSGTAFRERRSLMCNDILNDPATLPWRDEVTRRGWRALAAFPIRMQGEVCGTLTVYADELNFFQKKEVALLEEAASDVSFALDNLAREEARQLGESSSVRLAAIVQSSDDAIIGKDINGVVISWNAGAEKIFGYPAHEITGQSIMRLIPADRQQEEAEILTHVRGGESVRHFETVRVRKDGGAIDVSVTVSPIKDSTGKIIGASKIVRDITERKRSDEALRVTQERLGSALAAGAIGTWTWDIANDVLTADEYTALVFSVEPAAAAKGLSAAAYLQAVETEDRPAIEAGLANAIETCGPYDIEYRVRQKNGTLRWLQARGRVESDAAGKAVSFHGAVMDITARKQAEMAARDSEEKFRTMANSMSQLAWIAQPDGFIFWYNRRWYEYTGTTPKQMEGWGWQSVHDPEVLPKVMALWTAAINAGKPFEMEFPLRGADGLFRIFLTRGQPLKDSEGRVVQWFGTNTDVDELKRAEEKVSQLNAELEQRVAERTLQLEYANKELEAFSYSVSHDLRAPLRAMNGFAGIVLEEFGPQLPAQAAHYLNRIRNGGVKMGQLIDDLLAFSRLSRQSLKRQPVDTARLVQNVLDDLAPQREGRMIEIKTGTLPICWGDPSLLKQVWVNLLSNAVKYTSGRDPAVIEIGCDGKGEENVYYVSDNGTGFDMQYAHKLFGVFQRLHRADEFEGTGVGLAIVQRVIHRHGGRVWAEAELGWGATFRFTLEKEKTL